MPKYTSFDEWMRAVNAAVQRKTGGLSADDLSDYCYADAYEEGIPPSTVAGLAIRAAGGGE